ncbi:MAG: monooxygenase [Gammaproteobacteria bacterium]|nr:monooxygenase [Gammaproteobacteria bacterium]
MNAQINLASNERRDFIFIKPRKRRLTEYEAVTVHQQWETGGFDKGGHFLLAPDGRAPWRPESTALAHPNWFAFRDPAQHWQRTYIRMQAEQERAIERLAEDAAADGSFTAIEPTWRDRILAGHYRVWSFFEYGLFRAFATAQREALSDTLGNALCFQAFDHMRHGQAIVSHLLAIEESVPSFREGDAKARWLSDPAYQPARQLVERLIVCTDWAELAVAVNLVVAPLVSEVALGDLVRKPSALNGDSITPFIVTSAERDRRRNLAWTAEFVRMVTAADCPAATENRSVLQTWLARWRPQALAAAAAFAPIARQIPQPLFAIESLVEAAAAAQTKLVASCGLTSPGDDHVSSRK